MDYSYQQNQRFFAQVAGGIEALAAEELAELGASDISERYRGLFFTADFETLYRINYCSRLLSRVIAPLEGFQCRHTDQIYKKAKSMAWEDFFSVDDTFAVYANVSNSPINHSLFAALRVKDGIADRFTSKLGKRPNVDTKNPTVWINLHIDQDQGTIGIDTSNGPLHKRGYRRESILAPMQETLAAAIIRLSEWNGERPLFDPMCGSGTLLSEALMHISRTPAGYFRKRFGFEILPEFSQEIWDRVKKEADAQMREPAENCIAGSDESAKAVKTTRTNLAVLPFGDRIRIARRNYLDIPELSGKTIVTNPPYGLRLEMNTDMQYFYKTFGDFLKQRCAGSTAFVYFGEREHLKYLGLRPSWKKPLANGPLDGRLAKIELYK